MLISKQKVNVEQEKESIIWVRVGYKNLSLGISIWHPSANLVMPNGNPLDIFFYPTLMMVGWLI